MSNPLILLFFLSALITPSISGDTLTPPQRLADGQTLVSAGGSFALGFFSPPGTTNRYVGIWYNKVSIQTVVWVANRQNPIADHTGILSISGDGGLVITNPNSTVVWSAPASGATNPVAQLLDNGNLVVRDATAADPLSFQWQSFDHPTDTLLPGMKLGWNLTSGLNRNITAWTSDSDPSPAPYTLAMDARGDPQVFLWAGVTRKWRTGPWDGLRFTGVPDMATYSTFSFAFVANEDEVYYSFHTTFVSRLIVNQTGQTQRLVWIEASRSWNLFWFAPKDQCDSLSQCGPYGLCDPNDSPICDCLQGFDPKFPANWAMRDGSGGCVRRTPLDCRNGTDGFVAVTGAKLPDTSSAAVDRSMGLNDCRAACLANCSCKAYASANISEDGSGCIIWTADLTDLRVYTFGGQYLYVRVAAADLGSTTDGSHDSANAVVGIVVGAVVSGCLLLGGIGYCMWKKKKNKKRRSGTTAMGGSVSSADKYNDESTRDRELPLLDLDTIAAATDNFSLQNKLGEGGFGPVYKGKLREGQDIAVKRLAKTSLQGLDEFKNEVMLIAKLQHRNLVRLLGCCVQAEERMLVYEYMHNKSLDIFLFDKAKSAKLDWKTRYNIILGIARGLLYLHQDSRFRIIHRDLKASNILLDEAMNPKISDFGMARIFKGEESEVNTKKVVGTYGYMSPEYAMDGIFSVKSDVFSFGVLALEIISGKKNTSDYLSGRRQNLLGHAWSLWKEGKGLELVDESMGYSFTMTHEAGRCIKVGLLCVQEHPEDRPKMDSVVLMLGSEGASRASPKQPGFVATKSIVETDSSSSKQESSTINEITVTVLEGR